jgi:aminobenzoyl-glutamate transport protein
MIPPRDQTPAAPGTEASLRPLSENSPSPGTPPTGFDRLLRLLEKAGNALPHPGTLFALFSAAVLVLSWAMAKIDLTAAHPATKELLRPVDLLTASGLHKMLTEAIKNFTDFAPLGTVLVSMLGIGVAEHSGLIGAGLRVLVLTAPARLLTFAIVLAGVLSNTASEVGYVLLIPLSGLAFLAVKRHPLAGMAAAFAGVSGGYNANLFLGTIDPLLAGLSQEAARMYQPEYVVGPACNYYFMAASTFFIAAAGTWVTERIVEPRFGEFDPEHKGDGLAPLTASERRGLWAAGLVFALLTAVALAGLLPDQGFLRDPQTNEILNSPFMKGIVTLVFLVFTLCGIAYGFAAGTFTSDADIMKGMGKAMESMGTYLVLVFFAAQFVAFFKWSNLGLIFAVKGADVLKALELGPVPLMLLFILLSAFINLFMGSASAKWAIMAPVFIPMFMMLGFTPELVQTAYRIGDSVTNIISPMMTYFALILAFFEKYDKKSGLGTVIATMIPYTIAFFIVWSLLLAIWMGLGLPLGPGAHLFLPKG